MTLRTTGTTRITAAALLTTALLSTVSGCAASSAPDPEGPPVPHHVGTWGSVAEGAAHVTFEADGAVTGFDGCADLDGNWTQGDDGRVFTDSLGTSAAECDAPEAWLTDTAFVEVDGSQLVVRNGSKEELGRLGRVE
ncbi:META domain-containing protein [Agromyces sp. Marseille-P2726]|uniref:META domain-containing protein n=1 Tax=Agromyces sp. Marseille-P2726 TaxID=2709132 RepID=UPI001571485D|nr:META domain-containing protein [Agromyces sp. Marseille-P2726]